METSTLTDLLLNSTDLNRILCSFGIRNQSECEDLDAPPEPKGMRLEGPQYRLEGPQYRLEGPQYRVAPSTDWRAPSTEWLPVQTGGPPVH